MEAGEGGRWKEVEGVLQEGQEITCLGNSPHAGILLIVRFSDVVLPIV